MSLAAVDLPLVVDPPEPVPLPPTGGDVTTPFGPSVPALPMTVTAPAAVA